jgi:hypothetical protein
MPEFTEQHRALVDAFAHLGADIAVAPGDAGLQRLQWLAASALREQLRAPSPPQAPTAPPPALSAVLEGARAGLLRALDAIETEGGVAQEAPQRAALAVVRRDEPGRLFSGSLVDSVSALAPGERLGPFPTHGGLDAWFDVFYLPARRLEVRQAGAAAPDLVLTSARPAVGRRASTSIDIEAGTVWLRGGLLGGGLPAAAFVGVKVTGGSLKLSQQATITGNLVEVNAPLSGVLTLELAADDVVPAPGACTSSAVDVTLPDSLVFKFTAGVPAVQGGPGQAQAWGQSFDFGPCTGGWTFIDRLWTAVLGYDVAPQVFDADPIGDDLVHFEGQGDVARAGLGLPVVVAANPAILGEVALSASWFLQVQRLSARWYSPEPRLHALADVWIGLSGFGATVLAEGIAPLLPAVSHAYELWTLAGGVGQRLPWCQAYDSPFWLLYRCHVLDGEQLMVQGRADVALDRPVTSSGAPVATPTTLGIVLLQQLDGVVTALLGALVNDPDARHQFALRNALVWTRAPALILVRGALLNAVQIDAGIALLPFGVDAWVPTLPDPYVSNAFIRRPPRQRGLPQALLYGRVAWTAPAQAAVSFDGLLGPQLALGGRDASSGEPRPQRKGGSHAQAGPTQVAQGRLTFDRQGAADWQHAQDEEKKGRGRRFEIAQQLNKKSLGTIDGFMAEAVGPAPGLFLLDVSTNQDLLGVAFGARAGRDVGSTTSTAASSAIFPVADLAVHSQLSGMRVMALPQVQWEPVRTLDADQDIMTMGWFPTPLASATDGGATQIGARSQRLMPIIPEDALQGTFDAYKDGTTVGIRTTFPFGLVGAVALQPNDTPQRKADLYRLTRPKFPDEQATGGIQITAFAEGGRPDDGGVSPMFRGQMRQLLNGVDLPSGAPLGLSVLGETLQPAGSVETVFNNDMTANPKVPVTRLDVSGYGGSNFSDWNNPFAAFAEAAKVQFRYMVGRTALEVIKVNSVLHPWGVRVTRSVTIERRPGGGVIRRDSGWQAFTPGLFDYRYFDPGVGDIVVAPYQFDASIFRGLFNVRTIRPAPGEVFTHGTAQLVPYYFDADVALDGLAGRTGASGILGYLQIAPNGLPAGADAIQALIDAQGPIGGPLDAWIDFGGSGLPFRAQRVEVGLALDAGSPLFVATVRGAPRLPKTGAWSVVTRPVAGVPPGGGEAVPVAESRGVPVVRRYPVKYLAGDDTVFTEPRLDGVPGDYRFADAADLLTPGSPATDYALLQSTPTHAFLFPRPFVPAATAPRIHSGHQAALADILARSTSKGAFPPSGNTIELPAGSLHFDVGAQGKLALSSPVSIVGHPVPLRFAGSDGHGSSLFYDNATLHFDLREDRWEAEFTGLRVWSDISGLARITGSEMRIVGSTEQRPQIAEIKSLMLQEIEEILAYIPLFGARGVQGPVDLGASNAKHELKVDVRVGATIPPTQAVFPAGAGVKLKLFVKQSTGFDLAVGGAKASATFGVSLEGKVPLLSIGVAAVFLIVSGEVTFSLASVSGSVTSEKLELTAFVGVGVEGKIGPFKAYAFLGVGFVLVYDAIADQTKYGGLVALEAGVDLVIVNVKIRAELKGLVYKDAGATKCDYSGSVKLQVDIFLIFSISATYQVSETTTF